MGNGSTTTPNGANETALVLGGTGLLGSAIVRRLVAGGVSVVTAARNPPSTGDTSGITFQKVDVNAPDNLKEVLDGVKSVYYAVGNSLPLESLLDPVSDVVGSLPPLISVLEALKNEPETVFTYLSSGGTVYGNPRAIPVREDAECNPITGYGITKLAAEKYLMMYQLQYGLRAVIARVSNVYGPEQRAGRSQGVIATLLEAAQRGTPVELFGESVRDYVHVDDAADAVVRLSRVASRDSVFNVGSGVGHSLHDLVRIVENVTGRTLQLNPGRPRPADVREIVLDTELLSSAIEWTPRTLEDGIQDTWNALIARGHPQALEAQ